MAGILFNNIQVPTPCGLAVALSAAEGLCLQQQQAVSLTDLDKNRSCGNQERNPEPQWQRRNPNF